ncbi:MAG: bacillithiol system redox-active protein YtxJ [Candidatus Eremiobacteraeota bacterium]|nr:bacillithiol system redox-active protein YtxJ [Candidatus Eremiobacteraeota bacterium]
MINPCESREDYEKLVASSRAKPVLLLKHSTQCPISAKANREFETFAAAAGGVECWKIPVIEERDLARIIAEKTGIAHQSPQAILFVNGAPVWNASHYFITAESLRKACASALKQ